MLKVGQKLWYMPRHGNPREVVVGKIGRKWAEIIGLYKGRIYIASLVVDGGNDNSPGRCYLSKEIYEEEVERSKAWRLLVYDIERCRYAHDATIKEIEKVREILRIPVADRTK